MASEVPAQPWPEAAAGCQPAALQAAYSPEAPTPACPVWYARHRCRLCLQCGLQLRASRWAPLCPACWLDCRRFSMLCAGGCSVTDTEQASVGGSGSQLWEHSQHRHSLHSSWLRAPGSGLPERLGIAYTLGQAARPPSAAAGGSPAPILQHTPAPRQYEGTAETRALWRHSRAHSQLAQAAGEP